MNRLDVSRVEGMTFFIYSPRMRLSSVGGYAVRDRGRCIRVVRRRLYLSHVAGRWQWRRRVVTSENARSLRLLVSLLSDRCEVRAYTRVLVLYVCMYVGYCVSYYDGQSTSKLQVEIKQCKERPFFNFFVYCETKLNTQSSDIVAKTI